MSTTLRPARPDETATVARIWAEGWPDGHLGNVPEALVAIRTRESFDSRTAERLSATTVADVDGTVAGFVMVIEDEIEQLYVDAAHRGSGIAGDLLSEGERQIAEAGHGKAWLAVAPGNARAVRFYERSGWTDEGVFSYQAEGPDGPVPVPCHRYVKPLT